MGCKKRSGDFLSSDGHSRTSWFIWTPEEAVPSAILQISHGMCEYIERYESEGFIDAMTSAGFVVCGNDHIGHGRCAQENGDLGYFTDFSNLVDDLHTLNGIVRQTYRSLPYILLGHSMGSFVAREYIVKYDDINGAIICGTSAGNQPLRAAVMLAATLARLRGERHTMPLPRSMTVIHGCAPIQRFAGDTVRIRSAILHFRSARTASCSGCCRISPISAASRGAHVCRRRCRCCS